MRRTIILLQNDPAHLPYLMGGIFLLYPENHQQCWWFQKALALPSLFIRAKRGTHPLQIIKFKLTKWL